MKECIEREAVEKMLENAQIITYGEWCGYCTDDVNLDSIPAADVAEVVRCQDCKHRIYKDMGDDIGMIGGCQVLGVALPGDFYCAHGARMGKETAHD